MTQGEIRKLGREAVATELGPEIWAAQHGRLLDRGCVMLDGRCDCPRLPGHSMPECRKLIDDDGEWKGN